MSNTLRPTRHHIPMPTRNSDVHQIQACPGAWFLSLTREDEVRDTTFYGLGECVHAVIEQAIIEDLTLKQSLERATIWLREWVATADSPIETKARTVVGLQQDARRLLTNFYKYVWPGSPDRLELLDSYEWPPATEQPFMLSPSESDTEHGVWGRVDAIFTPKPGTGLAPLIVDFKGGVRRVKDFDQLDLYRFGLGMQEADAYYLYLDRSRRSDVLQLADTYVGDPRVKSRIKGAENWKKQLVSGGPAHFKPSALCKVCPVQHLCPEKARGQEKQDRMKALRIALKSAQPLVDIEVGEKVPA